MRNHVVSREGQDATNTAARSAAGWLSLAAAPTFAAMALLTALGGGPLDALCTSDASPLNGMALMYGLMGAFHLAPWLKLIARRRAQNFLSSPRKRGPMSPATCDRREGPFC